MRKKVMSWVLTVAMLLSTLSALPFTAAADPDPSFVCQVGETQYETLDEGLMAAAGGGTVVLLNDIARYTPIIVTGVSITIDLNGWNLEISETETNALEVYAGGVLNIIDVDGGEGALTVESSGANKACAFVSSGGKITATGTFTASYPGSGDNQGIIALCADGFGSSITLTGNATGYTAGAYATNNSEITVTGDVSGSYYGAYAAYGGFLSIAGDVTAVTRGLTVEYGGLAEVDGDITGETGIYTNNAGVWGIPAADIVGNVITTSYYAINAGVDADIYIEGNVTGQVYMSGTSASSAIEIVGDVTFNDGAAIAHESGTMVVTGNVSSATGWGVYSNSIFTLNGNITAKYGVISTSVSDITINGNITVDNGFGVYIYNGATVTVNGTITGASPYIRLDYVDYTEGSGVVEGNYMKYSCYTNNNPAYVHTVYVLIPSPVCEVDGVEYANLDDGIEAAAADWDTVKLLADIDYDGQLSPVFSEYPGVDLYINLNGHTLNVTNDAGPALVADGRSIDISGEGEFNVTGTTYGVYVTGGGSAEVTNATATADSGIAACAHSDGTTACSATVYGDATANGESAFGVSASNVNSRVTVYGDISANGTEGTGVQVLDGGNVTVRGYIKATKYINIQHAIINEGNYSSVVDNFYVYTDSLSTVKARQEVCTLNGDPYLFLEDAFADTVEGDTIALLADIRYQNEIVLIEKDLTLDLGSYTLNVGRTGSDGALRVDGSILTVDYSDGGELNIVDGYVGIRAQNEGSVTVTSISGLNGYGIIGESDSSVTVLEDISGMSYIGVGLSLYGGATAHVMGNVYSLDGIVVQESGSSAVIDGNISATNGRGAYVTNGGAIVVNGNITAQTRGIVGGTGGGTVHVLGDVTATRWEGVNAFSDSDIVVDGSVTSGYGLYAHANGTTILIKGDAQTTSAAQEIGAEPTYGAYALEGGEITVEGTLTPAVPANFAKVGTAVMAEADGVLDGRYTVYTDGESAVRLKGLEFFKEDFEGGTMAGWAQTVTGWSVTASLSLPAAAAHSGIYVAKFNSASLGSGASSLFYQTRSLNLTKGSSYWLEFWMYHDNDWIASDSVTVKISTDGGLNWSNLNTYFRNSETTGWTKEAIDLSAYVGEPDVRIAFLGTSGYGNNMYIDDITVSHICIIDGCPVTEAYGGYIQSREIEGETYYCVETPEQLAHINDHLDLNFIQTADIDLAGYNGGVWVPIGGYIDGDQSTDEDEFTGKYLGDGHTIDNLRLVSGDLGSNHIEAGLFARMTGAGSLVDGLTVNVIGIATQNDLSADFGGIVGALDDGTVSDCTVNYSGDVVTTCPNGSAGGIAGKAYFGLIENCDASFENGSILTEGWDKSAGGIVGEAASTIVGCHVVIGAGEMLKAPAVGGIAGRLNKMRSMGKYLEGCTVTGAGTLQLFSQKYYSAAIGGIAGSTWEGDIRNCENSATITAALSKLNDGEAAYAGGIVGYVGPNTSVFGCDNKGDLTLSIENLVVNSSDVKVDPTGVEYAYAGGIAGFINGYSVASSIENCQNDANIVSENKILHNRAYAGGIVGHIDSGNGENAGVTVKNCANVSSGNSVESYAATTLTGGIAGSSTYTDFAAPNIIIENCYNESEVYSESNGEADPESMCIGLTAGGIVGAAGEITVRACYSDAPDVHAVNIHGGDAYYGGIVGLIYNTELSQNYYQTSAFVTKAAGGIVSGMADIVAQSDVAGSYQGATAQNLKTKSFFGSAWKWYTSGGTAPDYYSASSPWRMTSATSYPALRGTAYTTSNPPTGGGGGSAVITYTITATAGAGGSISPSGSVTVEKLTSKTFTVKADTGYKIADVKVDGKSVGAVSSYTFDAVEAKHTIDAKFEKMSEVEKFSDVNPELWYAQGIEFVLSRGLFKGVTDDTFEPDTAMTRAMLVTVLHRLAGNPGAGISELFADVEEGSWFDEAVRWASGKGVVKGYGDSTFGPGISLTREQLAVILFRYAGESGYDTSARADLTVYTDAAEVSSWAMDAMRWAVAEGIISGTSLDTLDAGGPAGRAQVATILMRFVETFE